MSVTPRPQRRDRLLQEHIHDPYFNKHKFKEPTTCPDCGCVYRKGAWHWEESPQNARAQLCPACKRIKEGVPAGYLSLSGEYYDAHRDEIINLVNNVESQARHSHPLKRIMNINKSGEETLITLTDTHLTREIGDAIQHSQGGMLDVQYPSEGSTLRVVWQRDD